MKEAAVQAIIDGTIDRVLGQVSLLPLLAVFLVGGFLFARWAIGGPR
jgi:hypothetical protein